MLRTIKGLLVLISISALISAGLFYWWGQLTVSTFAQCVGGQPASGIDCAHNSQITASIAFASLAIVLGLAALIRGVRAGSSKRGAA